MALLVFSTDVAYAKGGLTITESGKPSGPTSLSGANEISQWDGTPESYVLAMVDPDLAAQRRAFNSFSNTSKKNQGGGFVSIIDYSPSQYAMTMKTSAKINPPRWYYVWIY